MGLVSCGKVNGSVSPDAAADDGSRSMDAAMAGDDSQRLSTDVAGESGSPDADSSARSSESGFDGPTGGSEGGPSADADVDANADANASDGGPPPGPVVAIAAGGLTSCALRASGAVSCWGDNETGQLGTSSGPQYCHPGQTGWCSTSPMMVPQLAGATTLAVGESSSCALAADSSLGCLPLGAAWNAMRVKAVSVGRNTCVVDVDGTVECFGDNTYGQLGGTGGGGQGPVTVANLSGAVAVSVGGRHACALLADGTVKCWGDNTYGELGDGTTTSSMTPVAVSNLTGVRGIAAAPDDRTCARLSDGTVECWGSQGFGGALGDGADAGPTATPVAVLNLAGATAIATGNGSACALLADTTVVCWGFIASALRGASDAGAPACGDAGECSTSLLPIDNLTGVTAIAMGYVHACALLAGGTVKCWGDNGMGQLGNGQGGSGVGFGTMPYSAIPVTVSIP